MRPRLKVYLPGYHFQKILMGMEWLDEFQTFWMSFLLADWCLFSKLLLAEMIHSSLNNRPLQQLHISAHPNIFGCGRVSGSNLIFFPVSDTVVLSLSPAAFHLALGRKLLVMLLKSNRYNVKPSRYCSKGNIFKLNVFIKFQTATKIAWQDKRA